MNTEGSLSSTIPKVAHNDLSSGYAKSDCLKSLAPIPIKGSVELMGNEAVYGTHGGPTISDASSQHLACDDAKANAEQHIEFITSKKAFRACSFGSESDKASVI